VLRELIPVGIVGVHALPGHPVVLLYRRGETGLVGRISVRHEVIPHPPLDVAEQLVCEKQLEVKNAGGTVPGRLRDSHLPARIIAPVGEVPARKTAYAAVIERIAAEIFEDLLGTRDEVEDEIGVVSVHHIVMQGIDVMQGVRGDILGKLRRGAAHGDTFRVAAHVGLAQIVADQTVVSCVEQGDQSLDAGVAEILELLVIGAVGICLYGAEPGRPPAYLHHLLQLPVIGVQRRFQLEREADEGAAQVIDLQGFVRGLDVEVHITESAPVKSRETLVGGTAGNQLVVAADEHLSLDFVAVALAALAPRTVGAGLLVKGFGILDHDFGVLSSGEA